MKSLSDRARVEVVATVRHEGLELPIHGIVIGTDDKAAPCLGVFGGVHGLERIGSDVVISWLQTISELMLWDETFQARLERSRLVFMPIVNPLGMLKRRRSNGHGVDLMRNAPIEAEEPPAFLLGGHRISNRLPWFRGGSGAGEMEVESKALCEFVAREVFPSRLALTVDVHSGFGQVDQFWFPYAKTRKPPPHIGEITALKRLFDRSYPNHFYRVEPQSLNYTTHGDLWDWLYDRKQIEAPEGLYIPWTLELGSWIWLKKNPRQLFSALGAFNPLKPHRTRRILRRHLTLFDFLHRALLSPAMWTGLSDETRLRLQSRAKNLWYEARRG